MFYGYNPDTNEIVVATKVADLQDQKFSLTHYAKMVRITAKAARREMIKYLDAVSSEGDGWRNYTASEVSEFYLEWYGNYAREIDFHPHPYELNIDYVDDVISNLY